MGGRRALTQPSVLVQQIGPQLRVLGKDFVRHLSHRTAAGADRRALHMARQRDPMPRSAPVVTSSLAAGNPQLDVPLRLTVLYDG